MLSGDRGGVGRTEKHQNPQDAASINLHGRRLTVKYKLGKFSRIQSFQHVIHQLQNGMLSSPGGIPGSPLCIAGCVCPAFELSLVGDVGEELVCPRWPLFSGPHA